MTTETKIAQLMLHQARHHITMKLFKCDKTGWLTIILTEDTEDQEVTYLSPSEAIVFSLEFCAKRRALQAWHRHHRVQVLRRREQLIARPYAWI